MNSRAGRRSAAVTGVLHAAGIGRGGHRIKLTNMHNRPLWALRLLLVLAVALAPALAAAGVAAATGQPQGGAAVAGEMAVGERTGAAAVEQDGAQAGGQSGGAGLSVQASAGYLEIAQGAGADRDGTAGSATFTPAASLSPLAAVEYYVAPGGDDAAAGSISAPLASMAGAQDKIRALKQLGPLPTGGVTVYFRGGVYPVAEGLHFTDEDSGTADAPVTYAAYPGEKPVFSGGSEFGQADFTAVPAGLASRLPQAERDAVVAVSLFDKGFTASDLGYDEPWWTEGEYQSSGLISVYVNDMPLHMAGYPNKIPGDFGGISYKQFIYLKNGGEWIEGGGTASGVQYPVLRLPAEVAARVASWQTTENVMFSGNYSYDWLQEHSIIRSFDAATGYLELNKNVISDDWERPQDFGKFFFENVLEELDAPGEYYIDKQTGTLVLYPPAGAGQGFTVKVPRSDRSADAIVECDGASYITFSGLTFENSQNKGFKARGGQHIALEGCVIRNVSAEGMILGDHDHGTGGLEMMYGNDGWYGDDHNAPGNGLYYRVVGCDIINTGATGCLIYTGDSSRRESGYLLFEDNVVEYNGIMHNLHAMEITGVGARVLNNRFAHLPAGGVGLALVDGEFAYNEIRDTFGDLGQDDGALIIATGQRYGLKVHDNYIHQIPRQGSEESWKQGGVSNRLGIYVDFIASGLELTRNVLVGCPHGITMPNSAILPVTYKNNIVIDSEIPFETFFIGNINDPWYSDKTGHFLLENALIFNYPAGLCDLYKNEWRDIYPEYYKFVNYYINEKADFSQNMDKVNDNVSINLGVEKLPQELNRHLPADGTPDAPVPDPKYGSYGNNRYLDNDPGLADYAGGDVQLSQEAADDLGIEWIDMSKIGAKRDLVDDGDAGDGDDGDDGDNGDNGDDGEGDGQPQLYAVLSDFGSWTGAGSASARVDAPASKFVRLANGDAELDAGTDYGIAEGSTVITLGEAYLKTLAQGGYSLVAHFTDGQSAAISLTVDLVPSGGGTQLPATDSGTPPENPPSSVPGTGDANALLLVAVAAASLTAALVALAGRRLRRRQAALRRR